MATRIQKSAPPPPARRTQSTNEAAPQKAKTSSPRGWLPAPGTRSSRARSTAAAKSAAPTRASLEKQAQTSQTRTFSLAQQLASATAPKAQENLQRQLGDAFGQWRGQVDALVKLGAIDSPQVKAFSSAVQQAALIQNNLPADALRTTGAAYRDAALKQVALDSVATHGQTVQSVVAANPLVAVPPLVSRPSVEDFKARGIPTTQITGSDGKPLTVRQDVVMVFAPGVVDNNGQLASQAETARRAGFEAEVAQTGTFTDPQKNAALIAQTIRDAQAKVGNPNAKVLLVGYSQGCTNSLAFMEDKKNQWPRLTRDVIGMHFMHSAAQGSQAADLAFAVGSWFSAGSKLTADQTRKLEAFSAALSKTDMVPGSPQQVHQAFTELREGLGAVENAIGAAGEVGQKVLSMAGIPNLPDHAAGRAVLKLLLNDNGEVQHALSHLPFFLKPLAAPLASAWQKLLSNPVRQVLSNGFLQPLVHRYIDGGLESLTTSYGSQLVSDPKLQQAMKNVPLLNSVGAVPPGREQQLVSPSQRLGYAYFRALGLDNDYQVAVQNQRLGSRFASAVDLPPEAIGHWGVAGLTTPMDHTPAYFSNYRPDGLTQAVLQTYGALGIV